MTDEVEELLHVLGPFYELVDEKKKISQISDLSTGGFFFFSHSPPCAQFVCDVEKKWHVALITLSNLPLVRCSARLTMFAKQMEGKYINHVSV